MDVVFLFHPLVCLLLQGTFTQCRFLVRTQIPHYFCVFFVRVFVCMCVLHKTTVHVVIIKSFPWLTQVELRASQTHPVCRCHSLPPRCLSVSVFLLPPLNCSFLLLCCTFLFHFVSCTLSPSGSSFAISISVCLWTFTIPFSIRNKSFKSILKSNQPHDWPFSRSWHTLTTHLCPVFPFKLPSFFVQ